MSRSPADKKPKAPAVRRVHPLQASLEICQKLGDSGKWVWMVGKGIELDGQKLNKTPEQIIADRLGYLQRAIAHLRAVAQSGGADKFRHLPVDPRTFAGKRRAVLVLTEVDTHFGYSDGWIRTRGEMDAAIRDAALHHGAHDCRCIVGGLLR